MGRGWFGARSEEYREAQRQLMLGREITWCDKLSESHLGNRHSEETKRKMSVAHKGRRKSMQTRENMRLAQLRRYANGCECGTCSVCMPPRSPTNLELALRRLLTEAGFRFEEQVPFHVFNVDAWVPSHCLVFEADGSYWHELNERKSPGYHARRERFLLTQGVLAVIHLDEKDLQPWIGGAK